MALPNSPTNLGGGNNTVTGFNNVENWIQGEGGNDSIDGSANDDLLAGGLGDDTLDGGNSGGNLNDTLFGGDGNDRLIGGPGNDQIEGGTGDDSILAGEGNDFVGDVVAPGGRVVDGDVAGAAATEGNDTIDGGDNNDTLLGGAGNDSLIGGNNNDSLDGGDGDDILSDSQASNAFFGGGGNDRVIVANNGTQYFDGGAGNDVLRIGLGQGNASAIQTVSGTININGTNYDYTHTFIANGYNVYMRNVEQIEFNGGNLVPVCFYPGTLIATPAGERAIETLATGDLVLTRDGTAAPIRWVGRQTVSTRFADPLRVLPIRITAGALGDGLPKRDLLVSPAHALLLDEVLVNAGALVNGSTITREADVPEVFTYFHVETAEHTLILAEGAPAETFVDNVSRESFDNWAEHEALLGDAPIAEMDLPRAMSHRQVPMAIRRRLDAIAASRTCATQAA